MKLPIKKLTMDARLPTYAREGDAGFDLYAVDSYRNHEFQYDEYGTGLAMKIPEGYVGLLVPRSSISKTSHMLCNSVGIIDSGYIGEIMFRFKYDENRPNLEYQIGDKIGQMVIVPFAQVEFDEVDSLPITQRGKTGFGGSGR